MNFETPPDITTLLQAWSNGDTDARDRLISIVYAELRKLASSCLRGHHADHPLRTTALVNEAYLRIRQASSVHCPSRSQFFGFAASIMRAVLVDHFRERKSIKRGGGVEHITLDEVPALSDEWGAQVMMLHQALSQLETLAPRQSQIVEMRFFGGMTNDEIAEVLNISTKTVKREWTIARAWLKRELERTT